jgi:LysR family glycine cleavage system transcriptional activator
MRWYLVYRGFHAEQRDFAAFRRWIIRAATEPAMQRHNTSHSKVLR